MPFTAKYTTQQKDACVSAVLDKGVKPYTLVAKLAAEGALTGEPFNIDPLYIGRLARDAKRRRLGLNATKLEALPPRDAVEVLRRRMLAIAEHHIDRLERKDKANKLTPKETADVIRVLRELAALPGPDQARPVKPGAKIPGENRNNGGPTRGGLAGAMLRDLENTPTPGAPHTPPNDTPKDTTTPDPEPEPTTHNPPPTTTQPDSWMGGRVAALLAEGSAEGDTGPG